MTTTTKKRRKTTRRGNGEGSIYFRQSDQRWVASVCVGYGDDGRMKRKPVYGKTKTEVQDKLTKLQGKKLDGTLDVHGNLTVSKYLATWLADDVRLTKRAATYESYEGIVRLHINPRVGGIALGKLTPLHVRSILSHMEDAGFSARRRQYVRTVLRRALKQAVKWGMIPRNVCDAVESPKVPKHEITVLDSDQSAKFLKAVEGDPLETFFIVAIGSGCRQGELLGLEWADLDLKASTLSVRRTLRVRKGETLTNEPKTVRGRRLVKLPAVAVDALVRHKAAALASKRLEFPLVFCQRKGEPLDRYRMIDRFKAILKAAGLPEVRFHDLRHSCATLLLKAGTNPKVVSERLGHSTIAITLDTYSHVLPDMQAEAADKLDGLLKANA